VRFLIKDVLWLTTLIGIGVGWYLDHSAAVARQQADWDALSRLDTTFQVQKHFLKEFQRELDELDRQQ
jgi:hypothetical protein